MEPKEILQRLAANGTADVTVTSDWGAIHEIIGGWVSGDLVVTASQVRAGPDGSVVASGTLATTTTGGFAWPAGAPVEIRLASATDAAGSGELHATVALGAPPAWTFGQSFPELPLVADLSPTSEQDRTSVLDGLGLTNVWLLFSTHTTSDELTLGQAAFGRVALGTGLNCVSRWHPGDLMGGVAALAGETTLSGLVVRASGQQRLGLGGASAPWESSTIPGIRLVGPLAAGLAVGSLSISPSFGAYTPLSQAWLDANPACTPTMGVFADLTVPAANVTGRIIAERLVGNSDRLEFVARFADGQHDGIDVDHLAALIGSGHQPRFLEATLPPAVAKALGSVRLKGLGVTLDAAPDGSHNVASTSFYFGLTTAPLTLLPDVSFDAVEGIELAIRQPFGSTEPLVDRLTGTLVFRSTVLGAKMLGVVSLPYFAIDLQLAESKTIGMGDVFGHQGLDASLQPAALVIEDFDVRADVRGNFEIGAKIAASPAWGVSVGNHTIALEEVGFRASRFSSGDKAASFLATLRLGDQAAAQGTIDVGVVAEMRTGASAGWHFRGGLQPASTIAVGHLAERLAHHFGAITVPASIADLVVDELSIEFDTADKNFATAMAVRFRIDGQERQVRLRLMIKHRTAGNGYDTTFDVTFGNVTFLVDDVAALTLAKYTGDLVVRPHVLVAALSGAVADVVPDGIEITIAEAFFVHDKPVVAAPPATTGRDGRFLFGISLAARFDLTMLPVVGHAFGRDTLAVDQLRFVVSSAALDKAAVAALSAPPPAGAGVTLPADPQAGTLPSGASVSARLTWSGQSRPMLLGAPPSTAATPAGAQPPATPTPPPATADKVKWFDIQKVLGVVSIRRVGVELDDGVLWVLLDASLSAGPLTISLDGLAAGSPLKEFAPQFGLRGMSVDFDEGGIEIGGAFLRRPGPPGEEDEYAGLATIRTPVFALTALGTYTRRSGHPSLFVYGVLDYPLGGPACFFITGLAAGFGYNRDLKMPAIDQVANFPLVAQAINPPGKPKDLEAVLSSLATSVPPDVGQIFLCAGIRFSTFELLDSFVLLAVQFGHRLEIDVLGLSTLLVPPAQEGGTEVSPLAEIQLALKATFIPDEGFFGIQAQLTSQSFLFSRACHLTGGFAFFTWFKDGYLGGKAGDFVITVGGYHPAYRKPSYYPDVPRVGFNWQVSKELSIKGGMYFALTGNALMAGGSLEALWDGGSLKAWFIIGADFLIAWKPYHYDARVYLDIGISFTFNLFGTHTITLDLGADLHIWGPEFSGVAQLHILIFTITIHFGAHANPKPTPIPWPEFRTSFLPAAEKICTIVVAGGLVGNAGDVATDLGVVNPKLFRLVIDSAVPTTALVWGSDAAPAQPGQPQINQQHINQQRIDIGSMGITDGSLASVMTITLTCDGHATKLGSDFVATPITKGVPRALWGSALTPDLHDTELIAGVVTGFEIQPARQPDGGHSRPVRRDALRFTTSPGGAALGLSPQQRRTSTLLSGARQRMETTLNAGTQAAARTALIEGWGFAAADIDLRPGYALGLLGDPRMVGS